MSSLKMMWKVEVELFNNKKLWQLNLQKRK